jgi:hypothetical protein
VAPLSEALSGSAKEAYTSAQILMNNNDFSGAYSKYEQAYALSKDPRLLFDMAVCARSLKAYARMQSLLVRYQREGQATMSAEDRSDVANALAAIRSLVGTVKLAVNEPDAKVAVDGTVVGTTPLADPLVLDLGTHTFSVQKPGFEPVSQSVEIAGGNETALTLTLRLHRQVARLVVSSDAGASVLVDDEPARAGSFEGEVTAGVHGVQVTEPGKVSYRTQVDLRDGETRTLQVSLETEGHRAAIWPWIVGGAAVAAGAVVGGYFLFRSQPASPAMPPDQLGSLQLSAWGR